MKPRFLFREGGQALIVIALGAVVLFGFTALAIDGSAKFSDRRHAQNAADTAALAASLARVNAIVAGQTNTPASCPPTSGLPSDVCTALLTAGKKLAGDNGYDDNKSTNTVEVYSPPISGYYAGKTDYVQVIITSHVKTFFMRILGIDESVNIVQAVALSKSSGSLFNGAAMVSLDPNPNCSNGNGSGGGSVNVGGNGTINLTGGGIFVNSSASCGYSQTSCSVTLTIANGGINSAGSNIYIQDKTNGNTCNTSGIPTNSSQTPYVVPDDIYMPDPPSQCSTAGSYTTSKKGKSTTYTFNPGHYDTFPPSAAKVGNSDDVVMSTGIYCLDSGFDWTNSSFNSLTGNNVTLYVKSGSFAIETNNNIALGPYTSGAYSGYTIFLPGSSTSIQNGCKINGGSNVVINGTLFAPYCNLTINGDSKTDSTLSAQVIAYDLTLNGNNVININYKPANNAKNPRRVGLMK